MPVAIVGPTASGKSDVGMAAAAAVAGTEIVAVDAMQVYRRMDIGTAKPTADDRAAIPHHCLDLVEPSERFTVADFQRAYVEAMATIDGQALLVAGTGLYLTAAIDELTLPGEWPAIRADLDARAIESETSLDAGSATHGLDGLYGQLQELDPVAAARIEPTNQRRIVRALEVCIGSGRPFSSFGPGITTYPERGVTQVGLRWPRERLAERIDVRVHRMIDDGLVTEVEQLLADPIGLSKTARQALGYKELIEHVTGDVSLDDAVDTIVTRTRRFAVRQERWFRRDPRIRWVDIDADPVGEVTPTVIDALTRSNA